ncbi:Haloalkane dehalogenase [Planctomycetes bacterium Pan216]|uniref:Haloalkane dehalogenase n=1 Tax=Kolteria novifilia TaxID=2527975 RepID=A0A518B6E2_9BACT|nr:Haloalkane dehalogenase [Planctomycetes bacterium Pan216]
MVTNIERNLIFKPEQHPAGDWLPQGLVYEDILFSTEDGVSLHGWYCTDADRREQPRIVVDEGTPKPVVLFFHGNAGSLAWRAELIREWLGSFDVDFFAIDYRGYGKSDGRPSEEGFYRDSRAAYRWLVEEKGISPERVVIFGRSLGGAVALELALAVEHRCLVIESTFTSLPDVARLVYPWLPFPWLMVTRFDNRDRISSYHRPLFIGHGKRDNLVPIQMAQELFELAGGPKELFEVADAQHIGLMAYGGEIYRRRLAAFLTGAFAEQATSDVSP